MLTAQFLVVVLKKVTYGDVFGPEEASDAAGREVDPDEVHHQEVFKVVPCADTRDVFVAIRAAGIDDGDWSVHRITPKGIVPQAVRFKHDGTIPYDVEIAE